ncbi:MAG: hypothetical protein QXF12_04345 [Candidatus Aenigmatarchaeota archaeon]
MDSNFEIFFEKEKDDHDNISEEKILETNENKNIYQLLRLIKQFDFETLKTYVSLKNEDIKKINSSLYPLLRWVSCVGINKIDWEEAKKQGRKKGDGKGPWPSKIFDVENTIISLINSNEINLYFWNLLKKNESGDNHVLLIYIMIKKFIPDLNKEEEYIWIKKPKSKKIKNKIDELLLKIFPNANSLELEILRKKYNNREGIKSLIQFLGLNNVDDHEYIE